MAFFIEINDSKFFMEPQKIPKSQSNPEKEELKKNKTKLEASGLPCGPVVKTPGPQCRGPRFDPWSGN